MCYSVPYHEGLANIDNQGMIMSYPTSCRISVISLVLDRRRMKVEM